MSTTNVRTLATLLAMTSGCTLVYKDEVFGEADTCKKDSDCDKLKDGDQQLFLCNADKLCQAIECRVNEDCTGGATCDTSSYTCNAPDASVDAGPIVKACKDNSECSDDGSSLCGFDGFCYEKWGCLDQEPDWLEAGNLTDAFTYKATMRSLQDPDAPDLLGKLTVKACSATDISCMRPRVNPEAVTVTKEKRVTVPFTGVGTSGFIGTIRVEAGLPMLTNPDDEPNPTFPGFFQFTPENPLVNNTITQDRALLIDSMTQQGLQLASGVALEAGATSAIFLLYDCGGQSAKDISVTPQEVVDDKLFIVPIQGEVNPLFTGQTTTTEDGVLFVGNLPANKTAAFVIKDEKLKRVITDTFSFIALKDGFNYVQYYPRYLAMKKWYDYAKANPNKVP